MKRDSRRIIKDLMKERGVYIQKENKKTGKMETVIDDKKFKEEFLDIQPPTHKPWKNKKQMKAVKKLRRDFLKSKEN